MRLKLMRLIGYLFGALSLLIIILAGITYSWTYTDHGRLDYMPAVLSKMAAWNDAPLEMTPEARAQIREMSASMVAEGAFAPGVRYEDRNIPRPDGSLLPIRLYWPAEAEGQGALPIYLDIHGGGWWMGDGYPMHDMNSHFANRSQAIVVSVEYRLTPEHPFPVQLDDCETALRWLHDNAASLGVDPTRLAVGGGSAGGNLAAALAIKMRDEAGPDIGFQFLYVPATDLSDTTDWASFAEMGDDYSLKVSGIHQMIAAYTPNAADQLLPTASPLLAEDLSGLPPALVVTALFDPLRDQGEAYAQALQAAGVPTVLHREEGSIHGFMGSPDRMQRIYDMGADAVHAALYPAP